MGLDGVPDGNKSTGAVSGSKNNSELLKQKSQCDTESSPSWEKGHRQHRSEHKCVFRSV